MMLLETVLRLVTCSRASRSVCGKKSRRYVMPFSCASLRRLIAVAALATVGVSAHASYVSITAEFTSLGIDFSGGGSDYSFLQLSVNGTRYTITNPAGIVVPLSGSSVTFGYGQLGFLQNVIAFAGSNSVAVTGASPSTDFTLGHFSFVNGQFYPFSPAYLQFTLTTHSSSASYDNHTFTGRMRFDTNQDLAPPFDPTIEADYFTLEQLRGITFTPLGYLGSVRVFDKLVCPDPLPANQTIWDRNVTNCNTGSVDLIGHISSLDLDAFASPTGGAFLNASTTSVLAPTNGTVPEPATLGLLALGLVGLCFGVGRRYLNNAPTHHAGRKYPSALLAVRIRPMLPVW